MSALAHGKRLRRVDPESPERGQALTVALTGFALVLLLMSAALLVTQYSGRIVARRLQYQGQALNAARAGLTETLSWFRRQPTLDNGFDPKESLNDTEAEAIGIVRTFEMSDAFGLSGRYTVNKARVIDITEQKGKSGQGTVWQLESTGCIARGLDFPLDCTTKDPRILARETVRSEIQRLNLVLPAGGAAIYARRGDGVKVNGPSKIRGGSGISIAWPAGSGAASVDAGSSVSPSAVVDSTVPPPLSIQSIFGVSSQELVSMADRDVTTLNDLENPMPSMSLIVIRGNVTFNNQFPLKGSGILVVFGHITVPANTDAMYSGVIYATGNIVLNQPALISGAVIAAGNGIVGPGGQGGQVNVNSAADAAEVDYDPDIIAQIRQQMGTYRFSRRMYIPGKQAN